MEIMRKAAALLVLAAVLLSLCACGKAGTKTLIYGDTDLSEYVKLGEYKGLSVDTKSDEYKTALQGIYDSDLANNDVYNKKLEGTVQNGDVVNIDFEGKKDGVAFEGGTSKGYDLTIGSGSFIAGFEEGLIGVNIGDTVDLNLTFPENYGNAELAGKDVVFTVKVNYVKSTDIGDISEYYEQLGFKSAKKYKADAKARAVKTMLSDMRTENSEVKGYPEKDKEIFVNAVYEFYDSYYQKNYGENFEDVLKNNYNMTVEDFKTEMKSSVEDQTKNTIIYYAVLQKENLKPEYELSEKEKVEQDVLDETLKVEYVVKDFLYDNAKIK